jgi:hypothetical protein
MLYWKANFQIPNSGVQSAEVYVISESTESQVIAKFYADKDFVNFLFEKIYEEKKVDDSEKYLMSLSEYSTYEKI